MSYTVYKHTSPSNKVYVGITSIDPIRRWGHGHGYRRNEYFFRAILKYGWDNFKHEILFTNLSKEEAESKEIELIKLYDSTNREKGYNLESGGNSIGKLSEETKRKLSEINKGKHLGKKNAFYGKTHTKEVRAKLSEINKGRQHTEETRAKMSETHTGMTGYWVGKHHSQETKEKISLSHYNPVVQKDMNGNVIAIYHNARTAEKQTGILHVLECCKGIRKSSGGYKWEFEIRRQELELRKKELEAKVW